MIMKNLHVLLDYPTLTVYPVSPFLFVFFFPLYLPRLFLIISFFSFSFTVLLHYILYINSPF
jgi:hypothetical protein